MHIQKLYWQNLRFHIIGAHLLIFGTLRICSYKHSLFKSKNIIQKPKEFLFPQIHAGLKIDAKTCLGFSVGFPVWNCQQFCCCFTEKQFALPFHQLIEMINVYPAIVVPLYTLFFVCVRLKLPLANEAVFCNKVLSLGFVYPFINHADGICGYSQLHMIKISCALLVFLDLQGQ